MALTARPAPRRPAIRRWWRGVAFWIAVGAAGLRGTGTVAAQTGPTEYQLKAVFVFNFAQFIEWPDSAFAAPGAPLVIGILGSDPFEGYLDQIARGETVNGHPLIVRRYDRPDLADAHILFVGRPKRGSAEAAMDSALARLRDRATLTVSDIDGFASRGGMIQFVMDRRRVRLRINLDAATAVRLKLSSKLLRPAEIVATGKD